MEVISLWHCWGGVEAQVSLAQAFSSSAFFGLFFLIFLLTIPRRFSMGFRSGEFAGQSSTPTPWSFTNSWCFWQCGQVSNPAGKWNQHLQKAGQQKEAWSAPKCLGKDRTPFLQTLGPWFPNEINLLSSEKRTLDHWATVHFFFSLTQVRRLWWQL